MKTFLVFIAVVNLRSCVSGAFKDDIKISESGECREISHIQFVFIAFYTIDIVLNERYQNQVCEFG